MPETKGALPNRALTRTGPEAMLILLASSEQEGWEAEHYRRLASSAKDSELARAYKELAQACERKAELLEKVQRETKKNPPVRREKP